MVVGGSSTRWWCRSPRRLLDSSLSTYTPICSYILNNFLWIKAKNQATHLHRLIRESPQGSWWERGEHNLTINTTHNLEWTQSGAFLPVEQRVWTPHWAPQFLRPAAEKGGPKTSNFKKTHLHKTTNWGMLLNGSFDSPD